jgi:type I restriction enzyme, S subunit
MRGSRFQTEVKKKAVQTTLPIINKSKWQSIDIFLPKSLNEQIDIRTKLRVLSDDIDSYKKIKSRKLIELKKLISAILVKELKPRLAA